MDTKFEHFYESVKADDGCCTTRRGTEYYAEYSKLLSGNVPLSVLTFSPKNPAAIVQLVHGMCEYKERYLPFMESLIDSGYACIIHDHRGHGASILSDDDYGYMYGASANELVEDTHQISLFAKRKWVGLPLVIFGHSMGSLVVRTYLKSYDYEPSAVILSGTVCENRAVGFGLALTKALAKIMGEKSRCHFIDDMSIGMYSRAFPDEPSCAWICTDKAVVEAYSKSPLCNFKFTLNGYCCLLGLLKKTFSKRGWAVSNPSLPILVSAGAQDPCAGNTKDFRHSVMFLWKLGYYHVQWKRYDSMRHEILNEPDGGRVISDYLCFIRKSLKMKNVPNKHI